MVAAIAAPLLLGSAAAAASPAHGGVRISTAFELPGDRAYPEGITADPYTGDIYTGSYADGTIFKTARGQRVAEQFLPAGVDGRTQALGREHGPAASGEELRDALLACHSLMQLAAQFGWAGGHSLVTRL